MTEPGLGQRFSPIDLDVTTDKDIAMINVTKSYLGNKAKFLGYVDRVLRDEALRQDLRRRGKANVARYCWNSSARQVSRLIDQAFTGVSDGRKADLQQLPLSQPKH